MRTIINFIKGFKKTAKVPQMVVLLFAINFLFSFVVAVPMYHSLKESIERSQVGENLAKGFDYLWWEEFRDESKGLARTFSPSIIGYGALLDNLENLVQMRFLQLPSSLLVAGLLYIVLHTFLAGGVLSLFNQNSSKFTMKSFFEGAGKYFFRFFFLMLISWLFFIAVAGLQGIFYSILDNISANALTEKTPFFFGLLFSAVILFLFMFIQMVFDYARINVVAEESKNILKSGLQGLGFVFRHLGSTLGLYYSLFTVSIAIAILYAYAKNFIHQSSFLGVFIAFLVQQIFIFAVIWLRCWLYSSQLELYKHSK